MIRTGVDPVRLYLSIAGLSYFRMEPVPGCRLRD